MCQMLQLSRAFTKPPLPVTRTLLCLTSAAVFLCPEVRPAFPSQRPAVAPSFAGKVQIPIPHTLRAVAVADFNRDGKRDMVTIDRWSNTITVLAGDGAGGFKPFSHSIGRDPYSLAAGDFNGDGRQDLAVGLYHDAGKVEILTNRWGRGAPLFTSVTTPIATGGPCFRLETATPAAIAQPTDIAVSDFNQDGRQDLVVSGRNYDGHPGCASVLFGDGAGGVGSQLKLPVGNNPESVVAGDFNGDDAPDFAVGNSKFNVGPTNTVSVFLGDG